MWIKIKNKKNQAFTLIELLLVIAIIGILATIITAAITNARQQSRDTRRVADIATIQQAIELYQMDVGVYPTGNNLVLGITATKCLNSSGWNAVGCADPYIDYIPSNPAPGGVDYIYVGSGSIFQINFQLEHGTSKFPAGPCRGLPAGVINCP